MATKTELSSQCLSVPKRDVAKGVQPAVVQPRGNAAAAEQLEGGTASSDNDWDAWASETAGVEAGPEAAEATSETPSIFNDPALVAAAIQKNRSVCLQAANANRGLVFAARDHLGLTVTGASFYALVDEEMVRAIGSYQLEHAIEPMNGILGDETLAAMRREGMLSRDATYWSERDAEDAAAVSGAVAAAQEQVAAAAGDDASVRDAVVALAASQIGTVNALDRGDGQKYGNERIAAFYDALGLGTDAGIDRAGSFKNDTSAGQSRHTGDWSWCGIFCMWAVKSATGKGGWSGRPTNGDEKEPTALPRGGRATLDQVQKGDIVVLTGSTVHHVLVERYDPAAKKIDVIEGNVLYQGIGRNTYDAAKVDTWYSIGGTMPKAAPAEAGPAAGGA